MTDFLIRRWLTGIAMLMMVVAMAGYAGHQHGDALHSQGASQCDFCAAFHAVADLPAASSLPVLVQPDLLRVLPAGLGVIFAVVRAHPPRAPPLLI